MYLYESINELFFCSSELLSILAAVCFRQIKSDLGTGSET